MTAKPWKGPFKFPPPIDGTCIKCDLPGRYLLNVLGLQARCCLEHTTEGLCSKEGGRTLAQAKKEIAEFEADRWRDANTHRMTWVPVAERLPEEGEFVLTFGPDMRPGHYIPITMFVQGKWRADGVWLVPTHWMPLPPPPRATT